MSPPYDTNFFVPAFPQDVDAPTPDLRKIAEHLRGISSVLRRTRRGFGVLADHLDSISGELETAAHPNPRPQIPGL